MPLRSSTATGDTTPRTTGENKRDFDEGQYRATTQHVLVLLLAFRIVNALTLRTFFQPDEYFQSLEPAWNIAFGRESGAWITWEWRTQLRSSLHPAIFASVYYAAAKLSDFLHLSLPVRAELYVAAPKVTQAAFAALLDCYTWRLAQSIYGRGTRAAWATLALSVCSPWQWFCSTRTLSNCLETTITSVAVYYWPWRSLDPADIKIAPRDREFRDGLKQITADKDLLGQLASLRLSLLLAAFACILRPTNLLIWLSISIPSLALATSRKRYILIREILLCGITILTCSVVSDRLYFKVWTLPPIRFIYFNIAQSLAVFYGANRRDYYLTEGLPLLLTTALPFAVAGAWQSTLGKFVHATEPTGAQGARGQLILRPLAWTIGVMTLALSMISHKEVRFLYPVLPFLHVLAGRPLTAFFAPRKTPRKILLGIFLSVNLIIAGYVTQVHQRGVVDVLHYLRHEHEARIKDGHATTVGFLMPCHSTPWRSHLIYSSINAWALTCEPPINVPLGERGQYLDEADQFYISLGPTKWLDQHMESTSTIGSTEERSTIGRKTTANQRPWPQYLVFFEQLEGTMREYLNDTQYRECWRGFNTHFHEDSRRKGDVIVWCIK